MNNGYEGRVAQVIGNIVDVEFPGGELPLINVALRIKRDHPDDQGHSEVIA
ncbi:MAG: hypothetical protein PHP98_11360, partial [Kiritimatiellae bacterium]|nr:hypothetical protein [Kiritimatiellia bacterium]